MLFTFSLQPQAHAQTDTLRLMQYNLTNYGNPVFSCPTVSPVTMKDSLIRRVVDFAKPDMLGCNEVYRNSMYAQRILQFVLNVNGDTSWATARSNYTAGSDLMNAFFYKKTKVGLKAQHTVNTAIRLLDHYRMYVKPQPGQTDTIFFNVIQAHLKAGQTSADAIDRSNQIATLNTYMATQDTAEGFVFQGDLNVYTSNEAGYQKLVNRAQGGFFVDPINKPGAWNNNGSFAAVHTQSPRVTGNGCQSGGGMDDRFDQQLTTKGLLNTSRRMFYAPAAFRTIGNDGNHFNQNINAGTNNAAPLLVLNALYNLSDHLPVMSKFVVRTPVAVKEHSQRAAVTGRIGVDGLHLTGIAADARLTFYSPTGAQLATATYHTNQEAMALPAGLPATGLVYVLVQDSQNRVAPTLLRLTLTL